MATKQFALPLDDNSKQTGDITFLALTRNNAAVVFKLNNVSSSNGTGKLNLITSKDGDQRDHLFDTVVYGGSAAVTLQPEEMLSVYGDAEDGDWDYVEAEWTADQVNTPNTSNMYGLQGTHTYNMFGWPPSK